MAILAFEREADRPARHPFERADHESDLAQTGPSTDGPERGARLRGLVRRVTIRQKLIAMASLAIVVFAVMTTLGVLRVGPSVSANGENAKAAASNAEMNAAHSAWLSGAAATQALVLAPSVESRAPGLTAGATQQIDTTYQATLKHLDGAIAAIGGGNGTDAAVKALQGLKEAVTAYHNEIQLKTVQQVRAGDTLAAGETALVKNQSVSAPIEGGFTKLVALAGTATHEQTAAIDSQPLRWS